MNKEENGIKLLLILLGTLTLVGLSVALKAYAVRWLWNDFLIDWAQITLPTLNWTKAFCVGIALTLSTNSIFKSNNGR